MDPLVLRTPGGDEIPLLSLSPLTGIEAEQRIDLLTGDVLRMRLTSHAPVDIPTNSTLAVFGQLYSLNLTPSFTKEGEHRYTYDLIFEGPQYHLRRVIFFDTDLQGNALSSTFSLTGNLALFAQVLFNNLARVFFGAWGLGSVSVPGESTDTGLPGTIIPGTETAIKTLSFENENCLGVLQRICTEWGTEFWIEYRPNDAPNRILHIVPVGESRADVYRYGQGKGLYELSRRSLEEKDFYTRAYIFGGTQNLPIGYRGGFATRLQLPAPELPAGQYPNPWDSFVQDLGAIATYGLIEGTQVFDDIYPGRIGTVAEVVDRLSFTDPSVDFDPFALSGTKVVAGQTKPVYRYIIDGITPKVSFLTGQLAGYSFELVKFFENNFILQLRSFKDERGLEFPGTDPSSPFKIAVGDTYTFIDMKMPDEYVTAAENKLLAAGQAWLKENGGPAVEYALSFDELFLRKKANDEGAIPLGAPPNLFSIGDAIRVVDTELGIDKMARITSYTRNVLRPYQYSLTLGDTRRISKLQRVLNQQTSIRGLVREKETTPAAGTAPQQVKTDIDDLKNTTTVIASGTRYTLTAGRLPRGFIPLNSNTLRRHELNVQVWEGIVGNLGAKPITIIDAIGRKKPFSNG